MTHLIVSLSLSLYTPFSRFPFSLYKGFQIWKPCERPFAHLFFRSRTHKTPTIISIQLLLYNLPPFYSWVLNLQTEEVGSCDMVLDNVLSSPHRRSPSYRKPFPPNELGSWSTLIRRHRFLLTALALLTFLCTIYLYFAVTLSPSSSCFGLNGVQKAQCQLELAKTSMAKGKLKIL